MHLSLYNEVVVFDQATKIAYTCVWLHLDEYQSPEHAYLAGKRRLRAMNEKLSTIPSLDQAKVPPPLLHPNLHSQNNIKLAKMSKRLSFHPPASLSLSILIGICINTAAVL